MFVSVANHSPIPTYAHTHTLPTPAASDERLALEAEELYLKAAEVQLWCTALCCTVLY
jgi:hypothetical protein